MELTIIFGFIASLLLVAVAANRLSGFTRVPDLIVLLTIGVLLGPVLHWADPSRFRNVVEVLGTLALILILFQGGLEIQLRSAVRYLPAGLLLAVTSFGCSIALIGLAGRYLLHLSWTDAILIAAALGCTSGSVVLPVLHQITTPNSIKIVLMTESSLGEILAVLTVGSMISVGGEQSFIVGLASGFARSIGIAVALGGIAGAIWSRFWHRLTRVAFHNVLNLGIVLGVYALSRFLGGSGLLASLVFGVTLANVPRTPEMVRAGMRMMAFHSELTFLVRSFFFVLLGFVAEFARRTYLLPILGILVGMLVARYVAVLATRWTVHDANAKEKELLFWMLPRGLVTAVLALEIVSARGPAFSFLPAVAFTVVVLSNLFVVWGSIRAANVVPVAALVPTPVAATGSAGNEPASKAAGAV
jgi:cell volume regulation protein A